MNLKQYCTGHTVHMVNFALTEIVLYLKWDETFSRLIVIITTQKMHADIWLHIFSEFFFLKY